MLPADFDQYVPNTTISDFKFVKVWHRSLITWYVTYSAGQHIDIVS